MAIDEYSKRLSRYCKLKIIEVPDEKAPEQMSISQEMIVKNREGERILKHVRDNAYVITLEIKGKMLSSDELASHVSRLGIEGKSNIVFVIGGSIGLSEEVMARSNYKLSFSNMTFPHQLMRVILLEQIYRAYRINHNEPYHK